MPNGLTVISVEYWSGPFLQKLIAADAETHS